MTKLTLFWQLLENRNDRTAVLAEWKQRIGDSFGAVSPLLTPTGGYAMAYPHPKPYGLKLRVIRHKNGDIVAVCPEDSDIRVPLTKTDIATYHINMEKMRKMLAGVFSLNPSRDTIDDSANYMLVGKYKPKPAAEFSVYMVIAKPTTFVSIIKDLCQMPRPFILLTTSLKYCTEEAYVLLDKKLSIIVPLDDVLEYSGVKVQCNDQWKEHLSVFAQKVNPTGRSNFANKPRKTGKMVNTNVQKIKDTLIKHINDQYDRIKSQTDRGYDVSPPPILKKQKLGQMVGIRPDEVTRAFKEEPQLQILLTISYSNEEILKYGKHRKR